MQRDAVKIVKKFVAVGILTALVPLYVEIATSPYDDPVLITWRQGAIKCTLAGSVVWAISEVKK